MAKTRKTSGKPNQKPVMAKRGPKAEVFGPVGGSLEQAIDNALARKKPTAGWSRR
ncbi:MAG TPA: hypothetical protein VHY37_04065 [Tepidisphaeraceae bacterium]|nr:hypothetical protein [Tepidisphaeraceae bacterium]